MAEWGWPLGRARGAAGGVAGTWPPRRAVDAGGVAPAGFGVWTGFLAKLQTWARAEASAWRLLPWVPVAFGAGIAVYFSAEHEPVLPVAALTAAMLCVGAFLARRSGFFPVLVLVAAVASGFAAATWRTERVAHVVLTRPLYSVQLAGYVETREIRARTDRFVLRVERMEARRSRIRLERVRLSVKKGTAPRVGSFVELKAHLQPPLSPLRPGGHNFARDMFFLGIGASGFVMGPIRIAPPPESGGLLLRYDALMQTLRDDINARVRTRLHGDERAIATTLLTGRRDAITEQVRDAIYISGLAHVLAIAGFHMAIVAGVVFFWVRALLALIPGLTIGFPIKKWAAAAALGAAGFYLLLSGLAVATQRAFFMAAVVLIGVMVDRRAITFRT
ncbi:MAG: ComEC/Rec2 family competence protein, partial [Bradyrhizobium sp.]